MSNTSSTDYLSYYAINRDLDPETIIGESDIIIDAITPSTSVYSEFDYSTTEKAFVAGIKDIESSYFTITSGHYFGLKHTDSNLNDKIVDAEKSCAENDNYKCWAATASNLLCRAGWLTAQFTTEDEVFSKFQNCFLMGSTCGGYITDGVDWFLTANYPHNYDPGIDCWTIGTAGYFSSIPNINIYLDNQQSINGSSSILENALSDIKHGYSVGIGLCSLSIFGGTSGHAVTLQGYTYEEVTDNNGKNREKITGIIIADSDDDRNAAGYNPSDAPNVLVVVPVHFILGDVFLDIAYDSERLNNGWSPFKIASSTVLKPADFTTLYSGDELVSSAATLANKMIGNDEAMDVFQYGLAANTTVTSGGIMTVYTGGSASLVQILGGGEMTVSYAASISSGVQIGGKMDVVTYANFSSANVVYQLDANTPQNDPLITNLSNMGGVSTLGLNVNRQESFGNYTLASNGGNFNSNGTVVVTDITNNSSLLSLHDWSHSSCSAGAKTYTLDYAGGVMTLEVGGVNANKTTRCDFHYNGISDVIYISGGTEGQTIQYGLDGTSELQNSGPQSSDLHFVGGYDMNSDHRADVVAHRKIEVNSSKYVEIGYAQSGDRFQWHEISRFNNPDDTDWFVRCGNLTGNTGKNSILWHAPSIGVLGYWADGGGNDSWVGIGNVYDSNWEVLGLGDFSNDSVHKDAVLFKYGINTIAEITTSGGFRWLGTLGSGWEIAAIGDFSNDGVDDLILYNGTLSLAGKWENGLDTSWSSLGTVETGTSIEGAGDYNGDGSMDLLARKSDGTMGYYASANLSQFISFGYTMDSSWSVIA